MIRRGEFYTWRPNILDRGRYVLVLSDDSANAVTWPIVAPIVRTGTGSLYLVPLADTDPVSGRVALAGLGPVNPKEIDGPAGMISGPTFDRVMNGITALFGM